MLIKGDESLVVATLADLAKERQEMNKIIRQQNAKLEQQDDKLRDENKRLHKEIVKLHKEDAKLRRAADPKPFRLKDHNVILELQKLIRKEMKQFITGQLTAIQN